MTDILKQQLEALILDRQSSIEQDMDLLQRLDETLLHADTHVVRQLEKILGEHERRREDAIGMVRNAMTGVGRVPRIEDRYDDRRFVAMDAQGVLQRIARAGA